MNKHQQSGMTTLLITSMLLIVALLFSLASYKNLFYQIKRTQNEVLARQAHWAAEGGLECGFAAIQDAGSISEARPTFISCESELNLADVDVDADNYIKSEYVGISNKIIKKKINLSSSITGAIQSRSDLRLVGSYNISPDVEDKESDNKYKCVAIRFSKEIKIEGALVSINPTGKVSYDKFLPGGICSASYQTHTHEATGSWDIDKTTNTDNPSKDGVFKLDLVRDTLFDPFESFFKDTVENIDVIKRDYKVIEGSKSSDIDKRCDYLIAEAFKDTDKVWVEGDCDLLDATKLNDMSASDLSKPKILVIANGIVATIGVNSFTGVMYHYINKNSNIYTGTELESRWNLMPSYTYNHGNNIIKPNITHNSIFINAGSFRPTGGMIFDTLNGHTTLMAGMTLAFTTEANPNPITKKISWQQGSWHDF
ncbi:hypothetical protein GLP22_14940 [Photobacterium carnosum]|uniref:hypothetical protein n=1 Tax=Photobacterium carnosum TaxID=2023717 RepID=UPI001E341BE2|nr:hypothetical protein [Photobacterium carnosum]MCD9542486.1 hypothetical protein [Photobacterium carnosum]